jgi:hypothetical protein
MKHLKESIHSLLRLQKPLPKSLADEVRLGNKALLRLHDQFVDISSELHVWTFYEAVDSQLSGLGLGPSGEVRFGAPLVSIKSSLLGVRQEQVYSIECDHAHCASFGQQNAEAMETYLADLALTVAKAEALSIKHSHTPLRLKEHVNVEIVGFYEDPDTEMESAIRLYITTHHLDDFLIKGPERCLEDRLSNNHRRRRRASSRHGTRPSTLKSLANMDSHPIGAAGLGIWMNMQTTIEGLASNLAKQVEGLSSPDIVVTLPSARPPVEGGATSESQAEALQHEQGLSVPALAGADFRRSSSRGSDGGVSTQSEPTREISPARSDPEPRGRATSFGSDVAVEEHKRIGSPTPKRQQTDRMDPPQALRDLMAGFSRPDPLLRRFMWIHLPFTNPLWVKARNNPGPSVTR